MPIRVIDTIKPNGLPLGSSQFPTMEDIDILGGYQVVNTDTIRNNIPVANRKQGMLVYVVADQLFYQLASDLVTWSIANINPIFFNVKNFGAIGNGSADDSTAILSAFTTASSGGIIYFPAGQYRISSNITFPAGVTHKFAPGAKLAPDSTKVITFSGTIDADPQSQIFIGAGSISFTIGSQDHVHAGWWGTSNLQAAVNATSAASGGRGIEIVLQNTTYNLGSGSVGLLISNHNTRIRGVIEGEDTLTYIPAPGGVSGPGALLSYSGTGTAVQVGTSGSLLTRNVRLENFTIQCAENTAKGLFVDGVSYLRCKAIHVFGLSGNTNACFYLAACVSSSFHACTANGQGTQTNPANYAVGLWAQSGVPTTTTQFYDCEFHVCYKAVYCNTAFLLFENSTFESSLHALWAGPAANIRASKCWFENNGGAQAGDGLTYESMVEVEATSSNVFIIDPNVVMYPGQYLATQVGTTGKLKVIRGTFTAGATANVTTATNASPIQITVDTALKLNTSYYVIISGVGGNTAANGTFSVTRVDDTHFTLNGTTGNGTYSGGGTVQVIPFLHTGTTETANSQIEWDDPTLITVGGGAAWQLSFASQRAVTGDVLNWITARFPKLQFRTYRFRATSLAASASINPLPSDNYAGGNFVMPAAGFILAMTTYYSNTITSGTIQVQAVQNNSVAVLDTGAVSALPVYINRGIFSVPVAKGDKLTSFCQTVGLSATGGDLEIEVLVGFGSGVF